MKSTPRHASKETCSCTSCVYKSESDHFSLRRMITGGSKVDRLYYGRYLPLRERNLLGKLVRTRAEYDDIRRLLLSGSSSSDISRANLIPRQRGQNTKNENNKLENNALSTLVNMVDKGVALGPHTSDDCCSCCSCSSKIRLEGDTSKIRRNVHMHPLPPAEYIQTRVREASKRRRHPRNVRFRTKLIKSDPCTCTFKFSGLMKKRQSKSKFMKTHQYKPEPVLEKFQATTEIRRHKVGKGERIVQTLEKQEGSQIRLIENMETKLRSSLKKLHESQTKLKDNLKASAKRSKDALKTRANASIEALKSTVKRSQEVLRNPSMKSKDAVKTTTRKSLEKNKQAKYKLKSPIQTKIFGSKSIEEAYADLNENVIQGQYFKIKDSITKYREELERKREMKDWECQFDCYPDECVPEECYKKLKIYTKDKQTKHKREVKELGYKRDKKVGAINRKQYKNQVRKHGRLSSVIEPRSQDSLNMMKKKQYSKTQVLKNESSDNVILHELRRISKSLTNLEDIVHKQNRLHQTLSTAPVVNEVAATTSKAKIQKTTTSKANELKILPKKERVQTKGNSRQAVRIGSSFDFNVEFYKTKVRDEDNRKSDYSFKIKKSASASNRSSNNKRSKHFMPTVKGENRKTKHTGKHKSIEIKPTLKDTKVGSHALKRCFCTLKLKPKSTKNKINKKITFSADSINKIESNTRGIQTNLSNTPSKIILDQPYALKPYECKPLICVPDECDPIECNKLIKNRHIKRRSILTATSKPAEVSSRIINEPFYKGTQNPVLTQKANLHSCLCVDDALEQALDSNLISRPNTQVVRIGSVNIAIYKDSTSDGFVNQINNDRKLDKSKRSRKSSKEFKFKKIKKHNNGKIKHKESQVSSSTGKSQNILKKTNLPRCFCTFKLGKRDKRINKMSKLSKGTLTSIQDYVPDKKIAHKNVSVMTTELRNRNIVSNLLLLPYECEPGICFPEECDPYKCLKFIKLRNDYKKPKKLNTEYRQTKSTSSFTSNSNSPSKAMQVQSTLIAHNIKAPHPRLTDFEHYKSKSARKYPNRQAVKIGSKFNLSLEFYKENPVSPTSDSYKIKTYNPSKLHAFSKGDLNSYAIRKINKSKQLHHRKIKQGNKSKTLTKQMGSFATENENKTFSIHNERKPKNIETASTATRTKEKYFNQLKPYECEPYICTPGECDPYQCLDRIKKRQVNQIGVATMHSKLKSASSITPSSLLKSKYKSVHVQSKFLDKKRKLSKNILSAHPNKLSNKPSSNIEPSRQVVRIGSSFSFDIEFFKKQSNPRNTSNFHTSTLGDVKSKSLRNQKKQTANKTVNQDQTQTSKAKTVHKGSEVGKILKRCFCTLQFRNKSKGFMALQKLKQPTKVYTVSMVTVHNTSVFRRHTKELTHYNVRKDILPSSCLQEQIKLRNDICKISDSENNSKCEIQKVNLNNTNFPPKKRSIGNNNENKGNDAQCVDILLKSNTDSTCTCFSHCVTDITGASCYLEKCFCTMNIQVDNNTKYKFRKKLAPYECEPGFCIPYQCDPLECQKRIMQRLKKQSSKIFGTSTSSKSSYTFHEVDTKAKKLQSDTGKNKKGSKKTSGLKYGKSAKSHRQAVRVGSCFKFDVEFSKDRTEPSIPVNFDTLENYQERPSEIRSFESGKIRKVRNKGLKGYPVGRLDKETQSFIQRMENKASSVTPLLKRCFCTLKLNDKWRQKELSKENVSQSTLTSYNKVVLPKAPKLTQSQSTMTPKFRKLKRYLEPYECEPGLCVPGECNPYECLKLIKMRNKQYKDFGTDSMQQKKISTMTTMSTEEKHGKRVQSNLKDNAHRQKVDGKSPKAQVKTKIPNNKRKNSRQAVRIGSSFSFNVEFYKEKVQPQVSKIPTEYFLKPQGEIKFTVKPKLRPKACQDEKKNSDVYSQANLSQTGKFTMTKSYLQRCFCTAKLNDTVMTQRYQKLEKKRPSILTIGSKSTSVQTRKFKKKRQKEIRNLEPYECEPSVCVPGYCNPYECEKRIKRRNEVGTLARMDSSISTSSMTSSLKSKNVNSQYRSRPKKVPYSADTTLAKSIAVKPQEQTSKTSEKRLRQAVRIGSSFSFDVEFFKDKLRGDNGSVVSKLRDNTKKPIKSNIYGSTQVGSLKNKPAQGRKSMRDNDSQVFSHKMRSAMTQMSPLLKRCFCTLKLRKQKNKRLPKSFTTTAIQNSMQFKEYSHQEAKIDKVNKTGKYKNFKMPVMYLEPYECEPGVCIPGECDPYECQKRIQMRNLRSQSTGTKNPKTSTSYAFSSSKIKGRKIQAKSDYYPHKTKQPLKTKEENYARTVRPPITSGNGSHKNAVRIGSSFKFDVEFFKDRSHKYGNYNYHYKENNIKRDNTDNYRSQSTKSTYQGVRFHHRPSQNTGPEIATKGSGVGPILKRCFCTLKLQKDGKNKIKLDQPNKRHRYEVKQHERQISGTHNGKTPPMKLVYNTSTAITNNKNPWSIHPHKCKPYSPDDQCCKQYFKTGLKLEYKGKGIKTFLNQCLSTFARKKTTRLPDNTNNLSHMKQNKVISRKHMLSNKKNRDKLFTSKQIPSISDTCKRDSNIYIAQNNNRHHCLKNIKKRQKEVHSVSTESNNPVPVSSSLMSRLNSTTQYRKYRCHTNEKKLKKVYKKKKKSMVIPITSKCSVNDIYKENSAYKPIRHNNITSFKNDEYNSPGSFKKMFKNNKFIAMPSVIAYKNIYFNNQTNEIKKSIAPRKNDIHRGEKKCPFHQPEFVVCYQVSHSIFPKTKYRPTRKPSCTSIPEQINKKYKIPKTGYKCKNKLCYELCTCNGECYPNKKRIAKEKIGKIKTILPYKPSKFKKYRSITDFSCSYNKPNDNGSCCSSCTCERPRKRKSTNNDRKEIEMQKNNVSIDGKRQKSDIKKDTWKQSVKRIVWKIKNIFLNKLSKPQGVETKTVEDRTKINEKVSIRKDILKYSKSEWRSENNINLKREPKKSKSLKISHISNTAKKNNCPCDITKQRYMARQAGDTNYKNVSQNDGKHRNKKVSFSSNKRKKSRKPINGLVFHEPVKLFGIKVAVKPKSSNLEQSKQLSGKYFIDQSLPVTPKTPPEFSYVQIPSQGKGDEITNNKLLGQKTEAIQIVDKAKDDKNAQNQIVSKSTKNTIESIRDKKNIVDENIKNTKMPRMVTGAEITKNKLTNQNITDVQNITDKQISYINDNNSIKNPIKPSKTKLNKTKSKTYKQQNELCECISRSSISKSSTAKSFLSIIISKSLNICKKAEPISKPKTIIQKQAYQKSNKLNRTILQNRNCECISSSPFSKTCSKKSCSSIIRNSIKVFQKPKQIPKDICSCAAIYKKTLEKEKILAHKRKVAEQRAKFLKKKKKAVEQKRKIYLETKKVASQKRQKIMMQKLAAEQKINRIKELNALKKAKKQLKLDDIAYQKRLKEYEKEDKLREKARMRSDEAAMKGFKSRPDILLCAESLCEVAKLGGRAVQSTGFTLFRFITDPRYAAYRAKKSWYFIKENPREALILMMKSPFYAFSSSFGRVKRRLGAMDVTKNASKRLRQYGVTSVMLDVAQGKSSKIKRKKAKRKKKEREPMDFQCSLYMASLRKRPYLKVYYLCPSFYPHFVSILLALKQFLQMSLFLLAIIVWCPCILCVELCRAFLCCCVCTQ